MAFLDSRPLARGHCLVIPRVHVPTLLDLPSGLAGPLLDATRRIARAAETGLHVDGSLVAINVKVSQSVRHLHVHVVPRSRGDWLPLRLVLRRRVYRDLADRMAVAEALAAALDQE
jgi:histidine triad (HIT) family protein